MRPPNFRTDLVFTRNGAGGLSAREMTASTSNSLPSSSAFRKKPAYRSPANTSISHSRLRFSLSITSPSARATSICPPPCRTCNATSLKVFMSKSYDRRSRKSISFFFVKIGHSPANSLFSVKKMPDPGYCPFFSKRKVLKKGNLSGLRIGL